MKQQTRRRLQRIAAGLLHDGLRTDQLSPQAKQELRLALDEILNLAKEADTFE